MILFKDLYVILILNGGDLSNLTNCPRVKGCHLYRAHFWTLHSTLLCRVEAWTLTYEFAPMFFLELHANKKTQKL